MAVRGGDWMKRMVVSGCGVCLEDVQRAVVSESKKNLGFFFVATPSSMCLQHDCSTISEREGLTKAPKYSLPIWDTTKGTEGLSLQKKN